MPSCVDEESIIQKYSSRMSIDGVTLTTLEMDRFIRKKYRREEVWRAVQVSLEYDDESHFLNAVLSDSMNDTLITKSGGFCVAGVRSESTARCPICLEREGFKIELDSCGCLFHEICVEEATQYSTVCPVCYVTINKKQSSIQDAEEKEKANEFDSDRIRNNDNVYEESEAFEALTRPFKVSRFYDRNENLESRGSLSGTIFNC
jgi:hypothetical protein